MKLIEESLNTFLENSKKNYNILNETKAFGQLRKTNKKLYDDTIKLEEKIGDDVLKMIDDSIEKENLKYNTKEEHNLSYLIILDLILSRFLEKSK
jgi:hypothetical protein